MPDVHEADCCIHFRWIIGTRALGSTGPGQRSQYRVSGRSNCGGNPDGISTRDHEGEYPIHKTCYRILPHVGVPSSHLLCVNLTTFPSEIR